jgi:two-component system chemotaxis response regulator CheY
LVKQPFRFDPLTELDCVLISTPRILITDDDRGFRETLGEVLQQRGYRTLLAADGEQAYRIVQNERVHVVLLDMHMPKWTGLETLRRVRQLRASLPCILMSGALDDKILAEARAARVFRVLSKPVSCRQVQDTVSAVLRAAPHRQASSPGPAGSPGPGQRPASDAD